MNAMEQYRLWLDRLADGDPLKDELNKIKDDERWLQEQKIHGY